jgi:hypothetical protein
MRTTEFAHLTAEAPLTVKAGSVVLAAFLFFVAALPVLVVGAAVVA